jgi:sugar lactone lactonase YvrE
MKRPRTLLPLLLAASCREPGEARIAADRAPAADDVIAGYSAAGATHVRTLMGFQDPESVRYDPDQDVFFVSNVAGFGSHKDGNGYIVRLSASRTDSAGVFIAGGATGVTLHAPKGMAIQGDTLWVTDIDVVRGFDRHTGVPVGTIDFAAFKPIQLNDIAAGPDGLRVTDTGIYMVYEGIVHTGPDKLFAVSAGRRVTLVTQAPDLRQPNGVTWDARAKRWLVVSFDRFTGDIWEPSGAPDSLGKAIRRGKGQLDGIEMLPDGSALFSSWADSSLHGLKDGKDVRVVRELPEPADIGVDTRRGRVLIPLSVLGHVQIWDLGTWWKR